MKLKVFRRLLRAFWVPVVLALLAVLLLREPLVSWLQGEERYDREALKEWVQESRVYLTLPELVNGWVEQHKTWQELQARQQSPDPKQRPTNDELQNVQRLLASSRTQIDVHLKAMCDPTTKVYPGRLPLFVTVYRMTVVFDDALDEKPIIWESGKPRQANQQVRSLPKLRLHDSGVWVELDYQARVYDQHQYYERQNISRWRWLSGLGLVFAVVAGLWF